MLQETYRYRPFYYISDNESPSALCLFEVNSWLTGRRGVSLPFTDQSHPLTSPDFPFDSHLDHARKIGQQRHWASLEIRGTPASTDYPASLSFYTHSLALSDDPATMLANVDPSARRAIRKAEKAQLDVSFQQTTDALRQYYALHCLTRRKHGLPPQPFRFFENIHRHIIEPGLGFIALAKHGEKAVAGAIFFCFKKAALYKFGASDPAHDTLRPNNLLMWQAIQHLAASGAKTLDFGRTSVTNEGLRRYKLQWGASEQTATYLKWHFRRGHFVKDTDRSSGLQNRIFRALPSPLTRAFGNFFYAHIG